MVFYGLENIFWFYLDISAVINGKWLDFSLTFISCILSYEQNVII